MPILVDNEHIRQRESLFGNQPIYLNHSLHRSVLFNRASLAHLIDCYVKDRREYTLVNMGPQGSTKKDWRYGRIGYLTGAQVIDRIERGRLWINLLHANEVDPAYQGLLDNIYAELHDKFRSHPPTYKRICGILISSPRAQVYYHFDSTGQNLWQITGTKRVLLYPVTRPFVTNEAIERCTLYHDETSIPYQNWFDHYAKQFNLEPGQMLHWQLNAPHRIENGDQLSVSLTTEFYTDQIQRHVRAVSGNCLLREFGLNPHYTLAGPSYYFKAGLFGVAKKANLLRKRAKNEPVFTLSEIKEAA